MVLTVHGEGGYQVHIDRGLLHRAGPLLAPIARRWAVITDDTVAPLYGDALCGSLAAAGLAAQVFTVPAGEGSKTLARYEALLRALAETGFTRADGVIALGGGVIGDLAGFVAATCLRGLPLVMAPTTLLAQADSAVGGKVGLDAPWGKNQIGAVYRPRLVLADTAALDTLPPRQFSCGMAEVIKYGMACDGEILTMLEKELPPEVWLPRCLAAKIALVEQDEMDRGPRHLLNFGHTFGHAYEALGGYATYTHGEAVAAGMAAMLRWQQGRGEDVSRSLARLLPLLEKYHLPAAIPCDTKALAGLLRRDKKGSGDGIRIVTLSAPGHGEIRRVSWDELMEGLA